MHIGTHEKNFLLTKIWRRFVRKSDCCSTSGVSNFSWSTSSARKKRFTDWASLRKEHSTDEREADTVAFAPDVEDADADDEHDRSHADLSDDEDGWGLAEIVFSGSNLPSRRALRLRLRHRRLKIKLVDHGRGWPRPDVSLTLSLGSHWRRIRPASPKKNLMPSFLPNEQAPTPPPPPNEHRSFETKCR